MDSLEKSKLPAQSYTETFVDHKLIYNINKWIFMLSGRHNHSFSKFCAEYMQLPI